MKGAIAADMDHPRLGNLKRPTTTTTLFIKGVRQPKDVGCESREMPTMAKPQEPMDAVAFSRPRHLTGVELVSVRYHNRTFPLHEHDCYVVGTVGGGAEALSVGRKTHTVEVGDVLQLHPGEAHSNRSLGDMPLRYRVFYLSQGCVAAFTESDRSLGFPAPVVSDRALSRKLTGLHELLASGPDRPLEQESALTTLVAMLGERTHAGCSPPRADHGLMAKVRDWISDHFTEDFGLIELAALVDLSAFRLAHVFKETTGLSPIAYRNQCRINEARRRLLTNRPIADIALELGFADQSHLTRQFQRTVGVSPGRYRQQ